MYFWSPGKVDKVNRHLEHSWCSIAAPTKRKCVQNHSPGPSWFLNSFLQHWWGRGSVNIRDKNYVDEVWDTKYCDLDYIFSSEWDHWWFMITSKGQDSVSNQSTYVLSWIMINIDNTIVRWASFLTNGRCTHNLSMGQQGSSLIDEQYTYIPLKDQPCVQSVILNGVYTQAAKGYVWSVKLQLNRRPTHSYFVNGSAMCTVSKSGAWWRINTLTHCQQVGNVFSQQNWSSMEEQHAQIDPQSVLQWGLSLMNDLHTHKHASKDGQQMLTASHPPPLNMNERYLHCYNSTVAWENHALILSMMWWSLNFSNMWDEIVWAEPRCCGSGCNEFQWLFLATEQVQEGTFQLYDISCTPSSFKSVHWVEMDSYLSSRTSAARLMSSPQSIS